MIVTCAECATQFQLDEARVPESGIRVRCSVCKHAFYVEHPDALGEASADPITRAVEEALDAEAGEVPEATQDLEAADAAAPASGLPDDAREEESWEFGDGGRLSEAGSRDPEAHFEESFEAARSAVDDLLGAPVFPRELAPIPGSDLEEEEEEERPPEQDAELDPFDAGGAAPVPIADDPWEVPAWSEGGAALEEPDREAAEPEALGEPNPLELDELETGEEPSPAMDLDPFGDELAGPPAFGDLATPGDGPFEEVGGLELDEAGEDLPPAAYALTEPVHSPGVTSEAPSIGFGAGLELEPRRALPQWFSRAGTALGWSTVAILGAAVLWASVAPRTAPGAGAGEQLLAGLEATGIEGRWVENAIVGPLYVVRGELRNEGSQPRAPGARLAVRLLDAEGAPLDQAGVVLAPPLEAASLREVHPRELRAVREAGAQEIARTPVAAGGSIAFEAVIEALPEAARRFDLVVAPPGVARPEGS